MSFRVGLWVCLVLILAPGTLGARRHTRSHRLSKTSLDDLVDRLNDSIQDQRKRLERGLPTIHYRTNVVSEEDEEDEGPTIIQSHWETDMTQPEEYMNDVQPWTRRDTSRPALALHDLQMVKLASDNARWVKDTGKCEVPLRRCVAVTSQYPAAGYKYWPRCAILHRCGDDAGCCNAQGHTCAMAESENVELYFFVYTQGDSGRAGVQRMTFANHTRCSCQPDESKEQNSLNSENCHCPKHFVITATDGQCSCLCPDGNSRCKRYRKGKRFFSSTDIECITNGECTAPTCEYGTFLLKKHRCPRRRERERYTVATRR